MGKCSCGYSTDLEKNCNGTHKIVKSVKNDIINKLESHKNEYLVYRGSSFSESGKVIWAKDDAQAYSDGINAAILLIQGKEIVLE